MADVGALPQGLNCAPSSSCQAGSAHRKLTKSISECTCQYRGVAFVPRSGRWRTTFKHKTHRYCLGTFSTPQEAARVWDLAAMKSRGPDFTGLNFPRETYAYEIDLLERYTFEETLHLLQVKLIDAKRTGRAVKRKLDSALEAEKAQGASPTAGPTSADGASLHLPRHEPRSSDSCLASPTRKGNLCVATPRSHRASHHNPFARPHVSAKRSSATAPATSRCGSAPSSTAAPSVDLLAPMAGGHPRTVTTHDVAPTTSSAAEQSRPESNVEVDTDAILVNGPHRGPSGPFADLCMNLSMATDAAQHLLDAAQDRHTSHRLDDQPPSPLSPQSAPPGQLLSPELADASPVARYPRLNASAVAFNRGLQPLSYSGACPQMELGGYGIARGPRRLSLELDPVAQHDCGSLHRMCGYGGPAFATLPTLYRSTSEQGESTNRVEPYSHLRGACVPSSGLAEMDTPLWPRAKAASYGLSAPSSPAGDPPPSPAVQGESPRPRDAMAGLYGGPHGAAIPRTSSLDDLRSLRAEATACPGASPVSAPATTLVAATQPCQSLPETGRYSTVMWPQQQRASCPGNHSAAAAIGDVPLWRGPVRESWSSEGRVCSSFPGQRGGGDADAFVRPRWRRNGAEGLHAGVGEGGLAWNYSFDDLCVPSAAAPSAVCPPVSQDDLCVPVRPISGAGPMGMGCAEPARLSPAMPMALDREAALSRAVECGLVSSCELRDDAVADAPGAAPEEPPAPAWALRRRVSNSAPHLQALGRGASSDCEHSVAVAACSSADDAALLRMSPKAEEPFMGFFGIKEELEGPCGPPGPTSPPPLPAWETLTGGDGCEDPLLAAMARAAPEDEEEGGSHGGGVSGPFDHVFLGAGAPTREGTLSAGVGSERAAGLGGALSAGPAAAVSQRLSRQCSAPFTRRHGATAPLPPLSSRHDWPRRSLEATPRHDAAGAPLRWEAPEAEAVDSARGDTDALDSARTDGAAPAPRPGQRSGAPVLDHGRSLTAEWLRVPVVPLPACARCHDDCVPAKAFPTVRGALGWPRSGGPGSSAVGSALGSYAGAGGAAASGPRSASWASQNLSHASFNFHDVPRLGVASSFASEGSEVAAAARCEGPAPPLRAARAGFAADGAALCYPLEEGREGEGADIWAPMAATTAQGW